MMAEGESAKNLGSPIRVVFITFLIFLASQIIVAPIILELGRLIFSPHSNVAFDKYISGSIPAQFFFILAAEGAAAWMAIKLVQRRHLGLKVIGLGRRPMRRDIWQALVGFGAYYGLLIIS